MNESVSVTGTVLNLQTDASSHFSMQFDIGYVLAGSHDNCGSTTEYAITNFSASVADLRVGSTPVAAPADFTAYLSTVTCPQLSQELVSGPMSLQANGILLQNDQVIVNGNVGSWWIEAAKVQVTGVPEPGTLALLLAAVSAGVVKRVWGRMTHAAPAQVPG